MPNDISIPQITVPDAWVSGTEANLPYAPGWSATAGPNPFALPKLPSLPSLPSIGDMLSGIPKMSDAAGADIGGAVGDAAWWLGGRVIIVVIGLILIVAGLYLFGTSDVASALRNAAKKSVA